MHDTTVAQGFLPVEVPQAGALLVRKTPLGVESNCMARTERGGWLMAGRYLSLAFILPSSVLVGYVIGYLLDKAFGTSFLYIVFLLIGIAAGFIELIREVQRDSSD